LLAVIWLAVDRADTWHRKSSSVCSASRCSSGRRSSTHWTASVRRLSGTSGMQMIGCHAEQSQRSQSSSAMKSSNGLWTLRHPQKASVWMENCTETTNFLCTWQSLSWTTS
jgi:hypothetical protein